MNLDRQIQLFWAGIVLGGVLAFLGQAEAAKYLWVACFIWWLIGLAYQLRPADREGEE